VSIDNNLIYHPVIITVVGGKAFVGLSLAEPTAYGRLSYPTSAAVIIIAAAPTENKQQHKDQNDKCHITHEISLALKNPKPKKVHSLGALN
jgi:hypothetical protein